MKQQIENIIKENLPEEKEEYGFLGDEPEKCEMITDHEVVWCGDCYACINCGWEFIPQSWSNEHINKINTSLIADEVLKVVVEQVKKQDTDFWFKLIENLNKQYAEDQMESYLISAGKLRDEIINLLSTLSPNKDNK